MPHNTQSLFDSEKHNAAKIFKTQVGGRYSTLSMFCCDGDTLTGNTKEVNININSQKGILEAKEEETTLDH